MAAGMTYRERWDSYLNEVSREQVPSSRLKVILRDILHDREDTTVRRWREGANLDFAFTPTPVEQLLRFVGEAYGRLQEPLTDLLDDDLSEPDAEARRLQYFAEHPEHFQRFGNLRLMVRLALRARPPRALSDVERIRLFAQWSNLRHKCAQLRGKPGTEEASRKRSLVDLKRIEEEIAYLSTSDREVRGLQAQCLYRRASIAPPYQPDLAAKHLRALFSMDTSEIPAGLYFHAARRFCRLPEEQRVMVLSENRMLLAIAFALIDRSRALDRIGICLMLALDAVNCHAPDAATRMARAVQCLRRATPTVDGFARTKRQIDGLHRRVLREIADFRRMRQDLAEYRLATANRIRIEKRVGETGAMMKSQGIGPAAADLTRRFNERNKDDWFVETLYNAVSQSRITPALIEQEFLRKQEEALTDPLAYYDAHIGKDTNVFRFLITHPDMDHMTGLHRFHEQEESKQIINFWHTGEHDFNLATTTAKEWENCPYDKRDWDTYKELRASASNPKSHQKYQNDSGQYWTEDGLELWAPTPELEKLAVEKDQSNIISMVLKLSYKGRSIVLGGDATADETWPEIYPHLDMKNIDVLKASHHGRKSGYYRPAAKEMSPRLTITSVRNPDFAISGRLSFGNDQPSSEPLIK